MSAAWISKSRSNRSRTRARNGRQHRAKPWRPILFLLALWCTGLIFLAGSPYREFAQLAPGQRSPITVVSQAAFTTLDLAQTKLERDQAQESVPPIFSIDPSIQQTASRQIEKLFTKSTSESNQELKEAIDLLGLDVEAKVIEKIFGRKKGSEIYQAISSNLIQALQAGIITPADRRSAFRGIASQGNIALRTTFDDGLKQIALHDLRDSEKASQDVAKLIILSNSKLYRYESTLVALISHWTKPNLQYEADATEERRKKASEEVTTVRTTIATGATIVEAGERLTPQILEDLKNYYARMHELVTRQDHIMEFIGRGLLLLLALFIFAGAVKLLKCELFYNPPSQVLILLLSLLTLAPVRGLLLLVTAISLDSPRHGGLSFTPGFGSSPRCHFFGSLHRTRFRALDQSRRRDLFW